MKKILPIILLGLSLAAEATTKFYIADDETNFSNPERGFYTASEQDITKTTTTSNLTDGDFDANSGRSLVYRQYVFSGFREDSLSPAVLDLIDTDFATYRKNGFKCVLRFSYTVDETQVEGKYQDASPEIWKKHLEQLTPVMAKNADVIAVVQCGFIGVWGEWYYSSQGVGTKIPKEVRAALIDQLLAAVPASRAIQIRTPQFKKTYIGDNNPLTAEEAFTGTPRARIGHHNDAFLYEANNMGTYNNRKADMNYLDQECMYLPNGGETDVLTQEVYDKWATGEKAMADMAKVHFSYINQDYTALVMSNWKREGAFVEIAKHMGYRLQLVEATVPGVVRPTEALHVKMNIRNVGYASMYNERKAYVLLVGKDTTYTLPLASDMRLWAPNGALTEIDENLSLPAGIAEGMYDVALYMPDVYPSIANDVRYAVRLANYDLWDETRGYNMLGIQLNVSATAPEPQPEPEPVPEAGVDAISNLSGTAGYTSANLRWKNPGEEAKMDTIKVDLSQGMDTAYNGELGNSSATLTYADGVSSIAYETKAVWLWAGSKYPVDNLTGFTSFTFEVKGDGSNIIMYPYAHDGTWRWIEDAYSVSLSNKKWVQHTISPSAPLWGDATYKFGEKPIIDFGFIANPATAKKGSFEIRNVMVLKQHEFEDNFAGVRLVRKDGVAPTSLSDGTTVYFGKGTACTDAGLETGHTYYYAAYTYTKDGRVALPVIYSITIDGSALHEVMQPTDKSSYKTIQDGKLMIIHDGVHYNALGQRIN